MKPGEASARVRTLQRALIARGYRIPAGATGYFGSRTRAAVRRFQQDQGWTGSHADGIPGPGTLRRLSLSEGAGSSSGASSTKASSTTSSSTKSSPSSASAASRTAGSASYRVGEASTRVHRLQKALIARGYSIPAGATGYFGSRTLEAVKTFQRDQGWSGAQADGVPGPGTLRRLGL